MPTIVDFYSESNQNSGAAMRNGGNIKCSQSFTAIGVVLDSCKFYLKKVGSPTGNAVAKIYAHTGTFGTDGLPTGVALATSDNVDVSILTTAYQLITFTFTGAEKITLTNGIKYCVVLEYSGGSFLNEITVGMDTSSSSHSGNLAIYASSWTTYSAYDLCFYVYRDDIDHTQSCSDAVVCSTILKKTVVGLQVETLNISDNNTGLKSPTATEVVAVGWQNPTNAYSSDNQYAVGETLG